MTVGLNDAGNTASIDEGVAFVPAAGSQGPEPPLQ